MLYSFPKEILTLPDTQGDAYKTGLSLIKPAVERISFKVAVKDVLYQHLLKLTKSFREM